MIVADAIRYRMISGQYESLNMSHQTVTCYTVINIIAKIILWPFGYL